MSRNDVVIEANSETKIRWNV